MSDGGDNGGDVRHLPEALWQRLRSDPTNAPQYLALAAVDTWGTQARDYACRVRREHPNVSNRELAEMVRRRHATLARMQGAAAGLPATVWPVAGAAAAILPDLAALAWIQSRMVIHIAAVYGHDTTDRETAAEMLVLLGIYRTTEAARVAVAEAAKRVSTRLIHTYLRGATLALLKQLFRYVGIKFSRAGLLRAVPLISVPASAAVNDVSTRSLGKRAVEFYEIDPRSSRHR